MPAGGAAAQEAVRQEERRLQADRMVQLELECGRLSHGQAVPAGAVGGGGLVGRRGQRWQ